MFNKKTKKGFTIVELVIVIAVIAILAAVLIPTFAGLIKKAEISSDQTLVRNLNTSLAISSEGGGTGKSTMYETLEGMKEQGYVVDKLTPTSSKNEIVWDSENNQFVLVYENGDTYTGTTVEPTTDKSKMWKIYKEMPTESEYSVYLAGTSVTGDVEVKGVGFDAGENTGISTVTYKNETTTAKTVVLRTNSSNTQLNIDGYAGTSSSDGDKVSHYGDVKVVYVNSVGMGSYHEYGKLKGNFEDGGRQIYVTKGRVVAEKSSNVSKVFVQNEATQDSFKIEINVNEDVVIDAANKEVINDSNVRKNDNVLIPVEGAVAYSYTTRLTYTSLTDAMENGGKVKLLSNIDLGNEALTINKDVEIDFFGYNITGVHSANSAKTINIASGSNVVFSDSSSGEKGGVIDNTATGYSTFVVYVSGKLTINDGVKIINTASLSTSVAIYSSKDLVINNAYVSSLGIAIKTNLASNALTINDGLFEAGDYVISFYISQKPAQTIINGGKFTTTSTTKTSLSSKKATINGGIFSRWNISLNNDAVASGLNIVFDNESVEISSTVPTEYTAFGILNGKNCYVISENISKLILSVTECNVDVKKNAVISDAIFGSAKVDEFYNLTFNISENATLTGSLKVKSANVFKSGNGIMNISCNAFDENYVVTRNETGYKSAYKEELVVAEVEYTSGANGRITQVMIEQGNNAFAGYSSVRLIKDLDLTKKLLIASNVEIDLNGHKISGSKVVPEDGKTVALFELTSNCVVTIKDSSKEQTGTIEASNGMYCINVGTDLKTATLNILSGRFISKDGITAVQVQNGIVNISGGYFEATDSSFLLNCVDENLSSATISVTGGSFKNFNPESNSVDGENTNYLADGYIATENNGIWTVTKAN